MKKFSLKILISLICIILFIACGTDENVIATVGELSITKQDLKEQLKNRYPKENDLANIDLQKKKDILDQIIQKKLKVQAAYELGLENDPEIKKAIRKQEENILSQKYFERVIVDKLISSEDIDEFIERQGLELKVTYILIGYDKSRIKNERTKEEAESLARKILDQAKNGKDFNELAMMYSDDPTVKNNKGDLGYFKWGQKPIPFQEACWDLNVGEFSDIVETSHGFNIIRLDDKKKNEEYIPDKNRETIFRTKQTLYSAVADSGKKLWDKTYKNIQKEKSYRYHSAAIKEATKIMSEKVEKNKIGMEFFTQAELNTTFAEWIDGEITLETILRRYEDNISRIMGALRKEKNLENEVRNLSMINLALVKAKEMNLDEEEDVSRTLNSFLEDRLVYLVEKNEINNKVDYTEEEVKKYYEDNPDQFMKPAQMEMWDIVVDNKDEAAKIVSQVRKGRDFETLAKKYSTDKFYKKKGGYLGFRTINARSSISRKAFEIGPNGKISEPIKYRDKWAIVKTGKLREKKLRPFHEVKRMAEGRLRNNKMAERRNEWSEELKNRYPIEIYEDKLTNL